MGMSEHKATILWNQPSPEYTQGRYSREHTWTFDGGLTVPASASPSVVRPPFSNPANIDPEEAFVASVASCHMLTFLHVARLAGFKVDRYEDTAIGKMTPNERKVPWISAVTLHPKVVYGGDKRPTADEEARLHHEAHEGCFIAQSVKTEITVAGAHPG
jgi:organic hydroperoxide reductase OsmC/OhrA